MPLLAEEPPTMLSKIKVKARSRDQGGPPPHYSHRTPKLSMMWQSLLPRVSALTLPESIKHRIAYLAT